MINFNSFQPNFSNPGLMAARPYPQPLPCQGPLSYGPSNDCPPPWIGAGQAACAPNRMPAHRHHHQRDRFSQLSPQQNQQLDQQCQGDFLNQLSNQDQKRQQAFDRLTQMGFTKVGLNIIDKAGHQVARGPGGFDPTSDAPFCPSEYGIGQALADKGLNASCWIRQSDGMQVVVSPAGEVSPVSLTTRE